jgi:hypothetical protein
LRLGINAIISLSGFSESWKYLSLNLADNEITDHGMHAVKTVISSLTSINLASNKISGDGLELILEDLIKNTTLKSLDLGSVDGSTNKNSMGIQGAICISALLIKNKCL